MLQEVFESGRKARNLAIGGISSGRTGGSITRGASAVDVLVTCPICVTMFEDAIKTEGLEEKLAVKDLSELMIEALS